MPRNRLMLHKISEYLFRIKTVLYQTRIYIIIKIKFIFCFLLTNLFILKCVGQKGSPLNGEFIPVSLKYFDVIAGSQITAGTTFSVSVYVLKSGSGRL